MLLVRDSMTREVVTVGSETTAAEAGTDPGTFTFTRTGDTSLALVVNYTVGGTATAISRPQLGSPP